MKALKHVGRNSLGAKQVHARAREIVEEIRGLQTSDETD